MVQPKYVLALCGSELEQTVPYPPELTEQILKRIDNFERECGAVIRNIPNEYKLKITASEEFSLITACMLVETEIMRNADVCDQYSSVSTEFDSNISNKETNNITTDTADLCKISVTDGNREITPKENLLLNQAHDDDDENQNEASIKKYSDMLDFVLKLGYTRNQLDQVLPQLGTDADRNDVLGALERSSSTPTDLDRNNSITISGDVADCQQVIDDAENLRPIIIDGSNVAMSFGRKEVFECRGIKIVVDWFKKRSHSTIIVFVPEWRKESSKPNTLIEDQHLMIELEREGILVFTPSRRVNGMRKTCYDDRYIVKTAVDLDGIIVSKDNFRDLQNENLEWKKFIAERLLMYAFVTDKFMPPDDPLGRNGPSLDNFLRIKPTQVEPITHCPYGTKCTFGNKCKYFHADRPRYKSVADSLKDNHKYRNKTKSPTGEKLGLEPRPTSFTAPLLSRREDTTNQSGSYSQTRRTSDAASSLPQYTKELQRNGQGHSEPVHFIATNQHHTFPLVSSQPKAYGQSHTEPLPPGYTKRPGRSSNPQDYQNSLASEMSHMQLRSQSDYQQDILPTYVSTVPHHITRRPSYPGFGPQVPVAHYNTPYATQSGQYYHEIPNQFDSYPQAPTERAMRSKGPMEPYPYTRPARVTHSPYISSHASNNPSQVKTISSNAPQPSVVSAPPKTQERPDGFEKKRRNMKHHLSALFGQQAVERAMLKLPDTTDPSEIVAVLNNVK
ncbi:probable ribonuclease ZC3H12D isoform X2 [Anneissia japonica]|uniref:probable ribonuclease ZC3H12D isoform X2 n=1 Tax=Anneissia japonica TaxID=1529436 RepID=UPI0014257454|nr:probable ribonuclease ZC3H12D isoform X2 [Anneissia japonica]